ncbi:MAG: hypothetical protein JRM80_05290 [Nitrososphaerota archaeon]|nr:hypothetical protein [Nitrososphaerota archaeon]
MARKSISIDHDVYEEFALQASRQNKTLFSFANEALALVSQTSAEGGTPDRLKSVWRITSILKEMDVITLPGDFMDELVAKVYAEDKDYLLKAFKDLGARIVPLLKTVTEDLDGLSSVAKEFAAILPVKEMNLVRKPDESVEILVVGAGRKMEATACMAEFIRGVLDGYQYSVMKQEMSLGIIRIMAVRRGAWAKEQARTISR